MLMPIVSMNKMAMNESVATTCCFRQKASPSNVYWEVLNGGWIGSGYVEVKSFNRASATTNGWTGFSWDVKELPSSGLPPVSKGLDGLWRVKLADGAGFMDVLWGIGDPPYDWVDLGEWMKSKKLSFKDGCCSHVDSDCIYFASEIQHRNNQHFQSTTKHSKGGANWSLPHTAVEFTS